jgi:predicted transposase YbfD/YdcC
MAARKRRSLVAHFESLEDPRLERTRKHNLFDIIALTICAVISGADSWVAVEKYGNAKLPWLQGFLPLPNGIASHDTIGRFFAALCPEQLRACFADWIAEMASCLGRKQIAIDGKTQRRSHDRSKGKAALHLISAWAVGNHLILGQEAVGQKSNEITAIPKLLALLDLEGALVTIDAMGCQREMAQQIVEQKGDYLVTVKENQPTLYAEIQRLEEAALANDYAGASHCSTEERSHGRQELPACWVLTAVEQLQERVGWPGLQSVVVVVRDWTVGEQNRCEKHYYITSAVGSCLRRSFCKGCGVIGGLRIPCIGCWMWCSTRMVAGCGRIMGRTILACYGGWRFRCSRRNKVRAASKSSG